MKHCCLVFLLSVFSMRAGAQACSDLFISEYQEGSSFNKVIEIFNPTTGTIDLSHYRLLVFFNGSDSAQSALTLNGSLPSGEVWVACHSSADSSVKEIADTSNSFVINWNGDDAVALVNTATGDTIDLIGQIGIDPGDSWTVSGGSTKDHTLVRNADVQQGTTDWNMSSMQWTVYDQNDFSNLGAHTMDPCDITTPSVFFTTDTLYVSEGAGTFQVSVGIINPNPNTTPVDLSVSGGTADPGTDFSLASPQTISFPANSSDPQMIEGTLTGDAIAESDEVIQLALSNPGNGAVITAGAMKITIVDDDGLGTAGANTGEEISVFPTVGEGIIYMLAGAAFSLRVFDIYGKEVMRMNQLSQKTMLDLQHCPEGLYLLQFESNHGLQVKEVLIQ
jgi:hypothetical protein